MSSPGTGLQQRAKRTSRLSIPFTLTPCAGLFRLSGETGLTSSADSFSSTFSSCFLALLFSETGTDLRGCNPAVTDGRKHVIHFVEVESARHFHELFFRHRLRTSKPSRRTSFSTASRPLAMFSSRLFFFEPLPDFASRMGRLHDFDPVLARAVGVLGGENLDDVAGFQLVIKRYDPAVHPGPDRTVADLGMDPIGKIERNRTSRQFDHFALSG